MSNTALLALEDGSIFQGVSIGIAGEAVGEVVFNTSMTGYQEILTDPSYAEQIITFTYPHVGNTGINLEDAESDQVWAKGMVIRDLPLLASNFRAKQSLSEFLTENNVVAIAEIDTRRLTRVLREKGSMKGAIIAFGSTTALEGPAALEAETIGSGELANDEPKVEQARSRCLQLAQEFAGLNGMDLAKEVTTKKEYSWSEGSWVLGKGFSQPTCNNSWNREFFVIAYDFGVKRNILRLMVDRGCRVKVVPAETPAEVVLAESPDGVFLSNGPGDPAPCEYAIQAIKILLEAGMPLFGICLGHQLLALASGAQTHKMKFGHHGANHPVKNLMTDVVAITSQNHGFAVDESTLPNHLEVTHRSLFDNSIQGIKHLNKPAFGFQGHPEASPGPQDIQSLFDDFINLMAKKS